MSKFPCQVCAACCLQIGKVVISAIAALDEAERTGTEIHPILEEIAQFPYDILENGACSKLRDGICSIYSARPLICDIEAMYNKFWSHLMSEKDYHIQSKMSCLKLQERLKKVNGQV
jgi:Fe-S-cluster containining protein